MKRLCYFAACLILICVLVVSCASTGNRQKDELSILFIGNSFTYGNNLPWLFGNICESCGYTDVKVGVIYSSGKSINWHAENIRKNGTYDHYYVNGKYDDKFKPSYLNVIKSDDWDYFIIQTYPSNVPDLYNYDIIYLY